MTKTYAITDAVLKQIDVLLATTGGSIQFLAKISNILTSLPLITGEPVVWRHDHGEENGGFEYYEEASCSKCQPLYAHPQPLQAITAEMVTDEMIKDIFPKSFSTLSKNSAMYNQVKNDSANIYNVVIKHKGDTK